MESDDYNLTLALVLIHRGQPMNNSYNLIGILERKFKITDVKKILDKIKNKQYATYEIVNGLHYYKLTSQGREFMESKYNETILFYHSKLPNEISFINDIFRKSGN
jgi:hypothetical protein